MSLKYFHLFFIAACLGLMAFLGYFSYLRSLERQPALALALLAGAGAISGLAYLRWFLSKYSLLP
ncbi:MAG: hypothetical protein HY549_08210 [Elusimicrobia bacterium]|nr:hypothetical protein [Elusimicrobiota bacterium]